MWNLLTFALLIAGLAHSTTCATTNFQCARYCKEDTGSRGYENGHVYKYSYSGTAKTLVNTTSQHVVDQTGVHINCVVAIRPQTSCDYVMEILEVTISDYHIKSSAKTVSKGNKFAQIGAQLKAKPLYFACNGKIDTICPDASESKEIIDIKRGILSVFQNSNPQFKENMLVYETDITGNCETRYQVTNAQNGARMVNRTKNLDACDHRMSNYFSWQTVPYTTTSNAKSLPLLKSTLNCMLQYGDHETAHKRAGYGDVLLESTCFEKHVFQPFSNGDNGALTTIEQAIKLLEIVPDTRQYNPPKDVKRSSLIYEYKEDKITSNHILTALEILEELRQKTKDGVDMDVPGIFSRLVAEFQRLSKRNLLEIFKQISPKQRIFFIDAISLITTNAGIEVMSELYGNKKLTEKQMNSWLVSVNFIKNPDKQTIRLIHPLTFNAKIRQSALLSLSSVLYKYCNKQNCLDDVVILEIVKNIEKPISNNCLISSENDKNEIFLVLKSLGNAGLTSNYYYLQSCYLNNELPVELRLAAIAAHRRMKCAENENLDDFKKLLANPRANSEVRIASYLASMQCASYASFAQVKDVLMREEANQVGSFIWTHLTNLQETSVPWKQGIKKLLENEFLQNKFNTDVRKYSRNYEASTFVDSVGAGGGVEANVIFTSESYLPRSAMLNFTLDLFGETINVLELGTRLEGFEDIVENMFSADSGTANVGQNNVQHTGNIKQERIDEFGEMFKVLPKQPSGTGYVKIFGNEISYTDFASLKGLFQGSMSSKAALDILVQLVKAPDIDYTKSFSLLDSTYKVPTILGFPLQLKTNATATIGLTAGGEVNMKDIRNHKMLIKGRVYPSVSVQVASTMSMDTYTGETGIQYLGALKSNMYIDGYVNVEMGKVVDVKINVPKKQMDIFTVASDLYIVHNDESYKIQDVSTQIDNSEYCTDQYLSKVTGLQFCNQWRFINSSSLTTPNFPLTGSFKYSMHIKKTDTFDFYKLYIETKLTDPNGQYLLDFLFDTPNSKIDRKLQCALSADLQDYKLSAHLHSPFANFQLHSSIEQELPKYKFQLMTTFNDKEVVTLMSTFDMKDEGDLVVYEPLAKINYKQQQIVALTGKLSRIKGGEYTADLKLQGIANEVAQIYGSFTCGTDYLTIQTNIMSTHFKGSLEAGLSARSNEVLGEAVLNYNYNNMIQETLTFLGKFNRSESETLNKNLLLLDLASSEWPSYNTHVYWENKRGHLFFNNTAEVMFFETTWRTHQILKLDKGFSDDKPDMLLLADLQSPQNNIDYTSKLQFSMSPEHIRSHVLFQLNRVQRTEALLDYTSKPTTDNVILLLYHAKKSWTLDGVLNKHPNRNYNFDVVCRHKSFDEEHVLLTLRGDYKNSSLGEMQTHKLNCTLDIPETNGEWRTPWLMTSTVQKSHSTFLSLSKVSTKEADYAGHFNWIEDSLSLSIQANDKQLFVLNAARTEEFVNIVLALNIHQHFELNTKLIMPYRKFDLHVYWDKDRDESQKFVFSIEQNSFKGQYNMDVEYPNQKITTNILLVPTQVIMNVTWGIVQSKKIYLKMGNKYYDDGGIWFGELETPFRYLERQQFKLQYAVVSDSFDVQSDLSWRFDHMNLLIAGSRSDTHLKGNLQLNTTLLEIRKVGVDLSHTHRSRDINDQLDYQSHAAFDYNDHSVRAESHWVMRGDKVDSSFLIESPSNTIDSISGSLNLNDDVEEEASTMNFILKWQKKNITAMYTFKRDTSSIEINTPFEGVEKTVMKYSVVTNAESVYLSTTIDIFKQNNSMTLSWTNTEEVTTCWLDLMSPMTGGYNVFFTHSVLLGKLNENFRIQGPENKDLLEMKVEGNIMPLLQMNVTASLLVLDHNATLTVINKKEPLVSNIIARWNGKLINSKVRLEFDSLQLILFNWLIESNLFAPVNVSYEKNSQDSITKIILPNDFALVNRYVHSSPHLINLFNLKAPELLLNIDLKTSKDNINQRVIAQLKDRKVEWDCNLLTQLGTSKKIDFGAMYNYFQGNNLVHSYNMNGTVQQTDNIERFTLNLNSTSTLNGHVDFQHQKASKLFGHALKLTCDIPSYCDLDALLNIEELSWKDKLSEQELNLSYKMDDNSLTTKLTTNYKNIPNGDLLFDFSNDRVDMKVNFQKYHISLSSNTNVRNTELVVKDQELDQVLARIEIDFRGIGKLNSSVHINRYQKLNASFNYYISPRHLKIESSLRTHLTTAEFASKFYSQQGGRMTGLINYQMNGKVYSSTIKLSGKNLDLFLKTPDDEYSGKMHNNFNQLLHTLDMELSSQKSKNYVKFVRKLDNFQVTASSDFLQIPTQEIRYSWDSWRNFTGEGHYIKGSDKHRFTLRSSSFKDWSIAYYKPNDDLFFNLNLNGRFESERDFDATVDGTWDGRKIKLELKNYFGTYYQTTFNLITPIKGWARTSLDCTLNEQKIGIALQAKGRYMSLIAGRSGDDMLLIEYMGETLLEMSSSAGHLTLRTTSYLGKYRLFVQVTHTPGIYVFSILKDGENLFSFMLQNYSVNDVLHYKGKLMAPEMIPNNSTVSVEFVADHRIWRYFNFAMKKDQKKLLEMGWENYKQRSKLNGFLYFQSQFDQALNFRLRPSITMQDLPLEVEVEMKYPCQKHTECSFNFALTGNKMMCSSLSSVDLLNFHVQSSFNYGDDSINSDFEFNDFKYTSIALNISSKASSHLRVNGIANFKEQSGMVTLNVEENNLQIEVGSSQGEVKYYLLAKGQIVNDHLVIDLHLPANEYFPNITTKANVSLKQGVVTVIRNSDKYESSWYSTTTNPRSAFSMYLKRNGVQIGDVTFENTHIKGQAFQSDTLLHLTYLGRTVDAELKALLSDNATSTSFTLFTPWEPLKKLNTRVLLQYASDRFKLEQLLELGGKEFNLMANGMAGRKGMVVTTTYKPWGSSHEQSQTISANLKYGSGNDKASYIFDIDLGSGQIFHGKFTPSSEQFVLELIAEKGGEAVFNFNKHNLDFRIKSLGVVNLLAFKMDYQKIILGADIMRYKQIFFAQQSAFGLVLDGPRDFKNKMAIIFKLKGELPPLDVSIDSYNAYKENAVVIVGDLLGHAAQFTMNQGSANFSLQVGSGYSLGVNYEENDSMYAITTKTLQKSSESLIVYKNYQKIKNQIYLPFDINVDMNTMTFELKSAACSLTISKDKQLFDIKMAGGHNHCQFGFNNKDNHLLVHYPREDQFIHLEYHQGRHQKMEFTLSNLVSLKFDIDGGLTVSFKQMVNGKEVQCDLEARSVYDITFEMSTNQERSVYWKSHVDDGWIAYELVAPKWKLLKVFDFSVSWVNNTEGKVIGVALKLDSEYTGPTEAGSIFEQKEFLLNIESYFKAPFLKGLETFQGKVYIPKEFRPHIEFILPNQTYKFHYDHMDNYLKTEVICRSERFSLILNNTSSKNVSLIVDFPDERFKSLVFKYTNYGLLELEVNKEYSLNVKSDLSYIDMRTPFKGYEKFGYLCERLLDKHRGEFKLVIVHPAYEEPLGVAFKINFRGVETLDVVYTVHTPFAIEGYDYIVVNASVTSFPEGFTSRINLVTNDIDIGSYFKFVISEERKMIEGDAHYNELFYTGTLNIEPKRIYMILGDPKKEEVNFREKFPEFNKFVSERLRMLYVEANEDKLDILVHLGPQPFSIQRSNNDFKLIWDLQNPNNTALGVKFIPDRSVEVFLADNHIVANQHRTGSSNTMNLHWNNLTFEYSSQYVDVTVVKGVHNITSVLRLETPLGRLRLTQQTSSSATRLIDRVEVDWVTTQPSKLIFDYEITPGMVTTSLSGSLLAHPLVLHVDMSEFRSIPSRLDASFVYSNETDKTINFSMRYNKTFLIANDVESVLTDRAFIIKHLSSKVDYELFFNAIRMDEFSNGSVTLKYKNFDNNKTEIIQGSVKVDHCKFGVHVEVTTGRNRFDFLASSTTGVKRHGFLVRVEINDKDPLNMECSYNFKKDSPSVSLMAAYGTSRRYVFYAGMPNEKEITAKLGHESYGRASLDAMAMMKLNTSQLLWMKVLWKDNLYAPFHEAILEEYHDIRYVIEAMGKELIDVVHDDMGKELITDCTNIKNHVINQTMADIQSSIKVLQKRELGMTNLKTICQLLSDSSLTEFLKENISFFYDITEHIVQNTFKSIQILLDTISSEIDTAMKDIKNIHHFKLDAKGILKRGINTARKSLKGMETVLVKLLDDFDRHVGNIKAQVEEFFDPFLSLVDDFIVYVEQRLTILQIAVLDTMDSIQQYVYNLREIKAMFSVYYSYINWLEELHVIKMLDPVTDVIEEILETIIQDVKGILDHYKPYLDALGDALFGKYDGIQQLPPIVEVREHVSRIYHKTIWVWNYHNMTRALKTCIRKFSTDVDRMLSVMDLDDFSASQDDAEYPFGYNYVFRPENRLIEVSQPLPVEWEAFNKSPSFANYPLYQRIQGKSEQFIKFYKSRYDLIDMLENFVVDLYEPSIAPTTLNYAMMIGKSQYTTFNGVNYNFLSNCSYLLASDFKTRSFSLIVNYRNASGVLRKSYEILSNDSTYEIFAADHVTLNGRKVDVPVIHKQVTIALEKGNIIAESSRGFKMICYFHYDYCTVQLSGWLFGKTAGLLGTMDNEAYTDVTSSQGTTNGLEHFISSWQLQKDQQCQLAIAPVLQPNDSDYVTQLCDLWFNNTKSPLNNCFDAIDPKLYSEMCYNELRANKELKVCAPAAAYVHRCRQARVAIEMPEFCVTCKDDIGYQEEIFDGLNNKTVDVVFITELDCYNETLVTRALPELLDGNLLRKQFVGNRFATVGYGGGALPKPHVRTHDGRVWSPSESVHVESRLNAGSTSVAKGKFTGVDAIKYAANLEYRVGVPKLFILTQCEVATDIGNSPDIYNMLGEKDITLHVIKPSPFGKNSSVMGIDLDSTLMKPTAKAPTTISSDQVINQIDDVYSGLALSTNGTIFDLDALDARNNGAQWARSLAARIRTSPCQKCKCVQDYNGVGRIECSRCLAPAVKQFLTEYEEGNKMQFNDNDDSH